MRTRTPYSDLATLEKLAETTGRGLHYATAGDRGDITRRQKKHDMLLTFMANTKTQKRRQAPVRPRLLTALLSLFF